MISLHAELDISVAPEHGRLMTHRQRKESSPVGASYHNTVENVNTMQWFINLQILHVEKNSFDGISNTLAQKEQKAGSASGPKKTD